MSNLKQDLTRGKRCPCPIGCGRQVTHVNLSVCTECFARISELTAPLLGLGRGRHARLAPQEQQELDRAGAILIRVHRRAARKIPA